MIALATLLALPPGAASAQSADEAFDRFGADSFSDTNRAIELLISAAHPQAAVIIEALADSPRPSEPPTTPPKTAKHHDTRLPR